MLELYYRPMACSLASRMALAEAGLEATYHRVDLVTKRLANGGDFRALAPKGQVPVLRTEDGRLLTEGAAVLQYIADRRPEAGLAPAPDDPRRYELQEWLNFIATELHKRFLFPTFMPGTPDAVREHARRGFDENIVHVGERLRGREYLVGDRFSVADTYLVWALTLARLAGVDLAAQPEITAYLERMEARPSVRRALEVEGAELQAELAARAGARS
jgi:glutathione S-transferase